MNRQQKRPGGLTLAQVSAAGLAGLIVLLGCLFYLVLSGSKQSIIQGADRLRSVGSEQIAARVTEYLWQAEKILTLFKVRSTNISVTPS